MTLKEARLKAGWSQQELSNEADVSVSLISRAENGTPISKTSLKRLCKALGVATTDIDGVSTTSSNK